MPIIDKLLNVILRYRWWVIAITVLVTLLAASGLRHTSLSTDYKIYFKADNPQRIANELLEENYTKADNVFVALAPADGEAFSVENLQILAAFTEEAWNTPFSTRVDSLTNFQHTTVIEDDLLVHDLFDPDEQHADDTSEKLQSVALSEPALRGQMVSKDGTVYGVNITIRLPGKDTIKETPEVIQYVRNLKQKFETDYPGFRVYLTGELPMNNAFSEASAKDMSSLLPLSLLVMFIILWIVCKTAYAPIAIFCVVFLTIFAALGLYGFSRVPLSPPSAAAPNILLAIIIASTVHVVIAFVRYMRDGDTKTDAIIRSMKFNIKPVFWTSATTAIGFLSLNFSEVPPFRHLGNIVAVGVGYAFVLTCVFLPALLSVLPFKVKHARHTESIATPGYDRLTEFVTNNSRIILISLGSLMLVSLAFIARNELNDNFVHYFDKSVEFRKATDFTNDNLTGMYRVQYALETDLPDGINEPRFMQDVEAFAEWLREQPEVSHVDALSDIVKRVNRDLYGGTSENYKIPDSREEIGQQLLLYETSLPFGLDVNNFLNVDRSGTRLMVALYSLSSKQLIALNERVNDWLAANTTVPKTYSAGISLTFAHIGQRNISSMLAATAAALLLISTILVFAFRSVRYGAISLIPNLLPAAVAFGIWGAFHGEIGLGLSVVTTLTLGIIVDDTIHFLNRFRIEREINKHDVVDAIRNTYRHVGDALITTSIVLGIGFFVFAFSTFEANSGMGVLTGIVIICALLTDLILLPALLIFLEERKNAKAMSDSVDTSINQSRVRGTVSP